VQPPTGSNRNDHGVIDIATRASNTVVAFPPRGGAGFPIPRNNMLRALDITNLHLLNMVRGLKEEAAKRDAVLDAAAPKSPEILLAMLTLAQMDTKAKEIIRAQVHELCHRGDEYAEQLVYWVGAAK